MEIKKLLRTVLVLLLLALPDIVFGQGKFSFTLNTSSRTSAGVYKPDGTLVKTLWSGVSYNAGTFTQSWDGTDDEGKLCPSGSYQIKLVSNNVNYTWEGIIGNTSDEFSGTSIHRGYHRIHGMAVSGNTVYIARNYSEGSPSQYKASLSKIQVRENFMPSGEGTGQETLCVTTDGNFVYWGGVDPFKDDVSFIFATKVSDDSEVMFSSGTAVKATYGRTYAKAINVVSSTNSWITAMAVQKTGNYLFASRKGLNNLYVLNKTTGALVRTLPYTSVYYLAVDNENNLWVHYVSSGNAVVQKYKVNSDGTLTNLNITINGLVSPQAMAVSYDGNTLVVADGGSSQQLKAFNNSTGASAWTFGKAGGYAKDATVSDDKFYFDDPMENVKGSSITFEADGSFWIVDSGNNRTQHFTASRTFIERIMYMPHFYSCTADKNNPTRVFANYLEFAIDYSKPLAPNNGSWKLAKNWGYNVPLELDNKYHRLRFTSTLSNGRTYALQEIAGLYNRWQVVELVEGGALRLTGVIIENINAGVQMYPDGSLRRISSTNVGAPVQFLKKPLTGFDASNNPVWGTETVMATSPVKTDKDPLYWGSEIKLNSGEVTSTNLVISFDGGLPPRGSSGYHLGAIKVGDNKWLWRTAKSTSETYSGPYPADGSYDIGNGAQYGGSASMVLDRNIFWGYHGEFWKSGQTNKWNHVYDNGLLVGQFGTSSWESGYIEAAPQMAGNVFAAQMVTDASGNVYLYHNDEGHHAGVHRWKVTGLNTIQEQVIPLTFALTSEKGLLAQYFDKSDMNIANVKSTRVDPTVNFNWSASIPTNTDITTSSNYSVNWSGFVKPLYSQAYTFYTKATGGVRLWVDGKLLIDKKTNTAATEFSGNTNLTAGQLYSIKVEYYKTQASGAMDLSWSSSSQAKQIIPSANLVPANVPDTSEGIDLLGGLPHGDVVLENNMYGWSRTPVEERYNDKLRDWWSAKTGSMSFDKTKSADLYVKFRQTTGTASITRDLGTNANLNSWKLSSKIALDRHNGNSTEAGMFVEVLDGAGKVISRFCLDLKYGSPKMTTIYGNSKVIAQGTETDLNLVVKLAQPLDITASSTGITFKYASYNAVTAPVFDATSNWKSPKTFRLYFFTNGNFNLDRIIDIEKLKFSKNESPSPNTPAAVTLAADDALNTLSASHTLGTSEIVVSENNGPYVAYSGTINVGNVARAAGYWKFKTKAATGRNESSVVNSPTFTATANTTPSAPTLSADDAANTLSASHTLGASEIVVSVNNGAYVAYSGTINVDNVARAAGYWKFKTKAATGRNESSVVNSPAFTTISMPSICAGTGNILREYWANASGVLISEIPISKIPTSTSMISSFETSSNVADNYGARVRGYICAPVTGGYTFWISGNDAFELWLSTSDDPAKKVKIAYSNTYSDYRQWDKFSSQKSVSIQLIAGIKYYVEALHKEGAKNDHLSVGWQLPDGSLERPIPGTRLSPFENTINSTPSAPSITADDINNTLYASHGLGSSEILVSVNNTAYVNYTGTINVGNVARSAGYWKFKIKAATGRNESSVMNSPAFTAVASNSTPSAPTISANDVSNTLSANHTLGASEIVVSENNGAYVTYTGTINVGNIARAAGYWKFKTKAATGRNESHVVSSPMFTVSSICEGTGTIFNEIWTDVAGESVSNIPVTNAPTSTRMLTLFETPSNFADSYASRVRGYICPPVTGNYTFWISGNDGFELWLSTSSDPSKKAKIAYSNSYSDYRQWDKFASQKSVSLNLVAGTKYYIEALHKEGLKSDHLSVGWQLPDGALERPIPGNRLLPFGSTNVARIEAAEKSLSEITCYPNPFTKDLTIEFKMETSGDATVELYNTNGEFIQKLYEGYAEAGNKQTNRFDGSNLASGLYIVKLSSKTEVLYKKVILNRQ